MRWVKGCVAWLVAGCACGSGCAGAGPIADCAPATESVEESAEANVIIGPVALQVERIMDGKVAKVLVVENMSKADALARLGRPERIRFTGRGRDWEYELRWGRVILHFGGEKLCGWTEKGIEGPMSLGRDKKEQSAERRPN